MELPWDFQVSFFSTHTDEHTDEHTDPTSYVVRLKNIISNLQPSKVLDYLMEVKICLNAVMYLYVMMLWRNHYSNHMMVPLKYWKELINISQ